LKRLLAIGDPDSIDSTRGPGARSRRHAWPPPSESGNQRSERARRSERFAQRRFRSANGNFRETPSEHVRERPRFHLVSRRAAARRRDDAGDLSRIDPGRFERHLNCLSRTLGANVKGVRAMRIVGGAEAGDFSPGRKATAGYRGQDEERRPFACDGAISFWIKWMQRSCRGGQTILR
jgi:hypothetical protein